MARALSPERLVRLHGDSLRYAKGEHWYGPIPEAFADLGVVAIRSHSEGMVQLRMRGCMDHYLDLVVYATDSGLHPGRSRVELWYDQWPRIEEVLLIMPEPIVRPVAIRLTSNNGSLPPPHRRSTTLVVRADGRATLEKLRGYKREPKALTAVNFEVDSAAHQQLSQQIAKLGLLSRDIPSTDRHPVGGRTTQLRFSGTDGEVHFPSFPADPADVELRDELASAVRALIPTDPVSATDSK